MKKLPGLAIIAILSLFVMSCGTGKKLTAANKQNTELNNQLTAVNTKLAESEKQVSQLKEENSKISRDARDCQEARQAADAKLDKINKDLERESDIIDSVLKRAESGIQKLEEAGAEVTYGEGLIHVSMPDKFMFTSGSSKVAAKGKEGLDVIAEILREYPNTELVVVGNTDTTHVAGKGDNWSLSTERANAVVRILRDNYKVDPSRLTAAGRGKYDPVASNDTAEGREKNRRVEFIIVPDLTQLWEMLGVD